MNFEMMIYVINQQFHYPENGHTYLYACLLCCYWSIQNTDRMENEQGKVSHQNNVAHSHTKDKTVSQDILSAMYFPHTSYKLWES